MPPLHRQRGGTDRRLSGASEISYASRKRIDKTGEYSSTTQTIEEAGIVASLSWGWCTRLEGRDIASPVLKIARLGLPLEITRDVLDDLRTVGRRDIAEGMAKGLTACSGQCHGHLMQRDTGLLPALHEGRHLTV